jgi:hypothetical protein
MRPTRPLYRSESLRPFAWLALCLASAAYASPARAWGDEGHRIIALIAGSYLTPAVRARVQELLATDDTGLVADTSIASEAIWADRYRDSDRASVGAHERAPRGSYPRSYLYPDEPTATRYEHTFRWHFVDLELSGPNLDRACYGHPPLLPGQPASKGPAEDCIVDKIDEFEAELASPATDGTERRVALQFLLHLVGDLHQPLHASTDHDAGGNRKRVVDQQGAQASLHGYWDVELVQRLGPDPQRVAAALIERISPADLAAWRRGQPADWAFESYQTAQRIAYGGLPAPGSRGEYLLSRGYIDAATAAVATQLSRAGVRLARLLNRALQ